jgi:murein DD-endopeptidase MepM/ murein hydrolase activator NlpD
MPKRRLVSLTIAVLALGGLAYGGQASFASSSPATYTVRSGDSLWSIAQAHGVTMQQLAAANGMQLSDLLLIGRTLVLPVATPATSPTTTSAATTPTTASPATAPVTTPTPTLPPSVSDAVGCAAPQWTGPRGVLPWMSSTEAALRPVFVTWATTYGVSPALLEAIAWQESGWQATVVSPDHAVGIGQLIPATAAFVSQDLIGKKLDVTSPDDNIQMMARFVSYLEAREGGNLCHTIAAYYEGPANLAEHGIFTISVPYIDDVEALLPRFE